MPQPLSRYQSGPAVALAATVALAGGYDSRFIGVGTDEFRKVLNAGVCLTAASAILAYATKADLARGYVVIALPSATFFDLSPGTRSVRGCTSSAASAAASESRGCRARGRGRRSHRRAAQGDLSRPLGRGSVPGRAGPTGQGGNRRDPGRRSAWARGRDSADVPGGHGGRARMPGDERHAAPRACLGAREDGYRPMRGTCPARRRRAAHHDQAGCGPAAAAHGPPGVHWRPSAHQDGIRPGLRPRRR